MSESKTVQKSGWPATVESIAADLAALGVVEGSLLLVHSSLSSLGWVSGGAVAVVEALLGAVGPKGTLVMPTHSTQLSDPANWQNPPVPEAWWPLIRETAPAFDPRTTPTRGMGAIPEYFRTLPEALRGEHPLYSFCALGPLAGEIVHPHPLEGCLGEDSPLGRLYTRDGAVLLLGVDHDSNTSLHLAENRAFAGKVGMLSNGAPLFVDGQRRWVEIEEPDVPETDLLEIGKSMRASTEIVIAGKVACAEAQLMPQPALVDFGEGWFREQ